MSSLDRHHCANLNLNQGIVSMMQALQHGMPMNLRFGIGRQ